MIWQDEDADAESFGLPYAADTMTRQFYLQDQMSFGAAAILLAAGHTDHETFGGHVTWNAEFGFALGDATMLTLAAGRAFRAPDATDLYGRSKLLGEVDYLHAITLRTSLIGHELETANALMIPAA